MKHITRSRPLIGFFVLATFVTFSFLSVSSPFLEALNCGIINIPVGTNPNFSLLVGRELYVTNNGSDQLSIVDTTDLNTDTIASSITVGTGPTHISHINGKLYVINRISQTVSVVDVANKTVIETLSIGPTAFRGVIVGTKLYVMNSGNHSVTVIDTNTDTVVTTITSGIGTSPNSAMAVGTKLYVNNLSATDSIGHVSVIDTETDTVITNVAVAGAPYGSSLFGTKLYVYGAFSDSVTIIDTTTDTTTALPFGGGAEPISGTVAGAKLYVNNISQGTVMVFDTVTDQLLETIVVGSAPTSSTYVNGKIYVNNAGSDDVSVIDTQTDTVIETVLVGQYPQSSALAGANLYVNNGGSNTISVIDVVQNDTFLCGTEYNFTVTYTAQHGSIEGDTPQTVSYGDNGSSVLAIPHENYEFVSWDDDSTENPRTDTNIISNLTVAAIFEYIGPGDPPPDDDDEDEQEQEEEVVEDSTTAGKRTGGSRCSNNQVYDVNTDTCHPVYSIQDVENIVPIAGTEMTPLLQCSPKFKSYIKKGWNNNPEQVTLWQIFLNQTMGSSLKTTGTYDDSTFQQTKAFQLKFKSEVLDPWGIDQPTGFVYKTTRMKANQLSDCPEKEPVILEGTGKTWVLP